MKLTTQIIAAMTFVVAAYGVSTAFSLNSLGKAEDRVSTVYTKDMKAIADSFSVINN